MKSLIIAAVPLTALTASPGLAGSCVDMVDTTPISSQACELRIKFAYPDLVPPRKVATQVVIRDGVGFVRYLPVRIVDKAAAEHPSEARRLLQD